MRATYDIDQTSEHVRNMPLTLEVTMTLAEWKRFRDELHEAVGTQANPDAAGQWYILVDRFLQNFKRRMFAQIEMGPYFEREPIPTKDTP